MAGYVAAVTIVRAWLNSLTTTLVGPGRPIPLGVLRTHPRSPGQGAYLLLSRIGRASDLVAEDLIDSPRISASIYAGTDEAAELAAVAYANTLTALSGAPAVMGDRRCLAADDVVGPLLVDNHDSDREQWQYLVDATFFIY
ncbi:hypothetical protein [Nonomuraea roseoviolacea]|uniref:DUF3168 domain-containing protein n=1 Tax=Nonomuraea roseoviolacea subsp. carminata TaxID=160689 RepID=A0ABT1KAK0_9ACTN|nr:hypothetical protein [Nonomuraea roseoviolacea]MCP2350617.1 hypothetical protein [Nonomuraea roseoviolacea subsp. carminata]